MLKCVRVQFLSWALASGPLCGLFAVISLLSVGTGLIMTGRKAPASGAIAVDNSFDALGRTTLPSAAGAIKSVLGAKTKTRNSGAQDGGRRMVVGPGHPLVVCESCGHSWPQGRDYEVCLKCGQVQGKIEPIQHKPVGADDDVEEEVVQEDDVDLHKSSKTFTSLRSVGAMTPGTVSWFMRGSQGRK